MNNKIEKLSEKLAKLVEEETNLDNEIDAKQRQKLRINFLQEQIKIREKEIASKNQILQSLEKEMDYIK